MIVADRGCGGIKPSLITAPSESLVDLRLYHHKGSWESEAVVNLTLPPRSWKELKFQYTFIGRQIMDTCREFTLFERVDGTLVDGTLMYDCHIRIKFGNDSMNIKLTVQSDSGRGASYLFRIPAGFRISEFATLGTPWVSAITVFALVLPLLYYDLTPSCQNLS
ncbi:hypothetical protein GWK47_053326 [Chionoecetes opilio]|uniref:Uncharacterized protein n=1 Tax=Chionoecetes opilio TaxID=41210 RepID=A0A8J4Y759_CHIOP|nr:hypothetical protein GWK47_053326 [Chionoecetes opilio]